MIRREKCNFRRLRLLWVYSIIIFGSIIVEGNQVLKTGDDFNTPVCSTDSECVIGGVCKPDASGKKRCMCSTSCLLTVPVKCMQSNPVSCLTMGETYVSKYNTSSPYCHHNRCVCPPLYDPVPVKTPTPGVPYIPPFKCDKRDLQIMLAASPADSVYKGTEATLYCCVNMDPRDYIPEEAVYFVQNGTRRREASTTPYQIFTTTDDSLFTVPTCWALSIANVQFSDSGTYSCITQPLGGNAPSLNETIHFTVKTPRMIQNITIKPEANSAMLIWDTQEGPMLKIGLQLFKRQGKKQEIWKGDNVKSPHNLTELEPATPYTLFISVQDGQAASFQFTEQFETAEGKPGSPEKEEIRLIDTTTGLQCEVEWRPPVISNGQVVKYFIQLAGRLRYQPQDAGANVPIDYPPAEEPCKNYDGSSDDDGIDAKKNFFACKFGPLKPNRNYAATIWSQNSAGKSEPVSYTDKCFMDYAAPDHIDPPEMVITHNASSFSLNFNSPPKETNGPIACYYLAIVPLPTNMSANNLQKPDDIVMESFEEAIRNNVQVAQGQTFYGYIAESYLTYPATTIIGDTKFPAKIEQCNVDYLGKARFKAQDPPLQPDLKYTGFLIVRVDRDKELHVRTQQTLQRVFQLRRSKKQASNKMFNFLRVNRQGFPRASRQLINMDPHYGYSEFFKPVHLQPPKAGISSFHVTIIVAACVLLFGAALVAILLYCRRKGYFQYLCTRKKDHKILQQAFQPIPAEDLASEFIIRHRDSDFLFSSEFEALPKKFRDVTYTACEKNPKKNRYGDIKAADETRVKLKVTSDGSDYINANFIKGYADKKTFIAAQAPVEHTVADFWQMIWDQDVRVVIMVANLKERNRSQVDKYWPEKGEEPRKANNGAEVHCRDITSYADYAKRSLELVHTKLPSNAVARSASFNQENEEEEGDYANLPVLRPNSKNSNNRTNLLESEYVNKEVRKVTHYHFTNWTDLKAPESTCGIMRLMMKLRRTDEYNNHPVLIHCSAGVGRTGTFIAIDYLIDQCAVEGKVDVFGTVSSLREQRNSTMVQSQEQYVFIYRALAENILFGDTDIPEEAFCDHLARLKHAPRERRISGSSQVRMSSLGVSYEANGGSNGSPPPTISNVTQAAPTPSMTTTSSVGAALNAKLKQWRNGMPNHNHKDLQASGKVTGMEAEYQKLFTCLDNVRVTNIAHRDENASKNRFHDIVPYDRYCIMLAPRLCPSSGQYINATPHRGYNQDYFMVQDPLDSVTAFDFWRLVNDHQTRILVMLSREDEFLPGEKYWPEQQGVLLLLGKDDELTVTMTSEKVLPSYIERKLAYKLKKLGSSAGDTEECIVTQYAFTGWVSGASTPPSSGPLRALIKKVTEQQERDPLKPGPIIVHSRDGSFEPGLFIALAAIFERLEVENMADVFRTARAVLQHRVGVFSKLEQYSFIYDSVADYIRSKS